ncbi:MAG TPA: benzoate-CoA ligase family protein, partial [Kofleriaceae bacterium]
MSPPRVDVPRDYNMAADLLERHVALGRGDRVAVVDDDGRYTYAWLDDRARRAAAALAALGVQPEQRVAVCMLDSVEWPAAFLGAIALGAVPVALNTLLTTDDYRYLIRDSRARVLIASEALLGKLEPALAEQPALQHVVVAGRSDTYPSWQSLVEAASPIAAYASTTADDIAFWLYSSGSTGKPKGAMHLHASARFTAALYAQPILGIREDDVVFSAAKLFFAYGLGNSLTFPFAVGASAALLAERPTPTAVMRMFDRHQPAIFCGVPTLFAQLLADSALGRRDHLRVSTSAGEALPRHVGERWRERVGSDILDGIGSTE